jgi:hypothetical protein
MEFVSPPQLEAYIKKRGTLVSTAENDQHPAQYGPLSLVIGVTGHRDLRPEDVPELEERVRSFFNSIRNKYPHTPLTLLSPLAEGADRLVASVALDCARFGARLIVPLPMRRELYEQDFTAPGSCAKFDELLKRAEHSFVLPLAKGYSEVEIQKPGEARSYQYEHVGAYIARHSQILLALWDGVCTDLIGGTFAIIKFQINGVPEPYAPPHSQLDAAESGDVYHIATPRLKNPQPAIEPFSIRKLSPSLDLCDDHQQPFSPSHIHNLPDQESEQVAGLHDRIYERIDEFNRDALEQASKLALELERSNNYILGNEEIEGLPVALRVMRERYAMADTLASHFQRRTKKTLNRLFVFAFVAALVFGVYAHLEFEWYGLHSWMLLIYVAITIIAFFALYLRASKRDYQNKYQDYRALAEGMRVQFFWCLTNLKLSVADHYLRKQRTELDWICSAVHAWNLPEENDDTKLAVGPDRLKRIELVYKYWVTAQLNYFIKSADKDRKELERYEPMIEGLFWAGVGLAFVLALSLLLPPPCRVSLEEHLSSSHNGHGLRVLFMSIPLVSAALLHNYTEKRAFSEHAKQYNRMAQLFATAQQRLQEMIRKGDYQGAQSLIVDLGKEALAENGDWVLLHRERPLEVPSAG